MEKPLAFLLDAPTNEGERSWVQVAKTGTFKDPRYGTFKITLSDFEKWIKNFKQLSLSEDHLGLPVDVDHSPEKEGDTEAVGWVKQLERRGNELWGEVEWNSLGKTLIADRRYAYISPSYHPNYKDEQGRAHGTAMVGIALTNRPFLKMATVNLSQYTFAAQHQPAGDNDGDDEGLNPEDVTDLDDMTCDELEQLSYKKGEAHPLDDLMLDISDPARQRHAVVVKKIDGKQKHMFPVPPGDKVHARAALSLLPKAIKAGHLTDQEAEAVRERARGVLGEPKQHSQAPSYSPSQMELTQVLQALSLSHSDLGVAEDADEATVLAAIAKRQEQAPEPKAPEGQVLLSQETVTKLTAQAAAGERAAQELHQAKFESAFAAAQREGKVTLAQKETFSELYDLDSDKAMKVLDGLPKSINMAPAGAGGHASDLDAASRALTGEFTDEVTPLGIDSDAMRLHAKAVEIEGAKNVPYEQALALAEAELGVGV